MLHLRIPIAESQRMRRGAIWTLSSIEQVQLVDSSTTEPNLYEWAACDGICPLNTPRQSEQVASYGPLLSNIGSAADEKNTRVNEPGALALQRFVTQPLL